MVEKNSDKGIAKAKEAVFRLLRFRPRSEKEIYEKLRIKGFKEKTIRDTVKYFRRLGLLNDSLFAQGWISSRLKKPFGIRRIRHELKQKGIAEEILDEQIAKASKNYDEIEALAELAKKQINHYKKLDEQTLQRRLFAYLARRGFSASSINKVMFTLRKKRP